MERTDAALEGSTASAELTLLLSCPSEAGRLLLPLLFACTSGLCASLTVILSTKDRSLCVCVLLTHQAFFFCTTSFPLPSYTKCIPFLYETRPPSLPTDQAFFLLKEEALGGEEQRIDSSSPRCPARDRREVPSNCGHPRASAPRPQTIRTSCT